MQIARVFFDVHMGQAFKGLSDICKKAGVKLDENYDNYVVFINSKHTKFKLLIGNQYLIYHDNKNEKFPLEAIQFLPNAFNGNEFKFSKAVEKSIKEKMRIQ